MCAENKEKYINDFLVLIQNFNKYSYHIYFFTKETT